LHGVLTFFGATGWMWVSRRYSARDVPLLAIVHRARKWLEISVGRSTFGRAWWSRDPSTLRSFDHGFADGSRVIHAFS